MPHPGRAFLKISNAMLLKDSSPAVEAGVPNAEVTARLPNITSRLSMLEHPKFCALSRA
jgi:hypothetical protein